MTPFFSVQPRGFVFFTYGEYDAADRALHSSHIINGQQLDAKKS